MKLKAVEIENFRAIEKLTLSLDPQLTVLHGANAHGKTSVLSAVAVGLGAIPTRLPGVSGINFRKTDLREGAQSVRVALTPVDGHAWRRIRTKQGRALAGVRGLAWLREQTGKLVDADSGGPPIDLPLVAFYDTDRVVFDLPQRRRGFKKEFPRFAALEGALSARTNFRTLFQWFYFKENEELREQNKRRDFDYRLRDLSTVRNAISSMLDDVSDPHIEVKPLRLVVNLDTAQNSEKLALDQLSGGYRAVLALTADLAWRMAQGNPHLDDPLRSEAVVLIDEIELHLHPSWQQRILDDLMRTFPNAQFIVSTHSPQVLTTVEPKHIVELARKDGRIVAGAPSGWTYGAEAGDVLSVVMGVKERPENRFTEALDRYGRLVSEGRGESEEARALRQTLDDLSPEDPALASADLEIRQRKLFKRMAESK